MAVAGGGLGCQSAKRNGASPHAGCRRRVRRERTGGTGLVLRRGREEWKDLGFFETRPPLCWPCLLKGRDREANATLGAMGEEHMYPMGLAAMAVDMYTFMYAFSARKLKRDTPQEREVVWRVNVHLSYRKQSCRSCVT